MNKGSKEDSCVAALVRFENRKETTRRTMLLFVGDQTQLAPSIYRLFRTYNQVAQTHLARILIE